MIPSFSRPPTSAIAAAASASPKREVIGGAHLAGGQQGLERIAVAGSLRRLLAFEPEDLVGEDPGALQQDQVQRHPGGGPGGEADDDEAPAVADRAQGGLRVAVADQVEDHVGGPAAGRLQRLLEVRLGVGDGDVGAELTTEGELLRGRGAGDDARPERLADPDRGAADRA